MSVGVRAEPVVTMTSQVQAALEEGALDDAGRLLLNTMQAAPESTVIVDAQTVAELLFYQGLLPRVQGAERADDLDHWRDALVVFPDLQWNKSILDNRDQQAVFEALRGEVGQRPAVATSVPPQRGLAVMYVDGVEHAEEQAVRGGKHLVQVACPDGQVAGRWTRFEEPVAWLKLCAVAVDVTQVPPEQEETDDFDFGMEENPRSGPDPLSISQVYVPPPLSFSEKWKDELFIGAGGTAVISGGLYVAALISRAKYDKLSGTNINTQADLDALRSKTNTQVGISAAFAGMSAGMATVAVFSGRW